VDYEWIGINEVKIVNDSLCSVKKEAVGYSCLSSYQPVNSSCT
jgi:hypothetical protein